ncbi:MAG: hypothetical protein COA78_25630 [Blastopirellula sp.]|nr:MAG: hypothetical protein COA78_25630 [Blastopirellula sp.]
MPNKKEVGIEITFPIPHKNQIQLKYSSPLAEVKISNFIYRKGTVIDKVTRIKGNKFPYRISSISPFLIFKKNNGNEVMIIGIPIESKNKYPIMPTGAPALLAIK